MSPTRSEMKILAAAFALVLALACSGTASESGAETTVAESAPTASGDEAVSLMVPSGSVLAIEFQQSLSSDESKPGDNFRATLSEPVYVGDQVAIDVGATISGTVVDAWSAERGKAQLNVQFTGLELASGAQVVIDATFHADGESDGKPPIGSNLVGRLSATDQAAGGEETVIGAIVGTENGTAVAAASDGQEIRIPSGTTLKIRLDEPVVLSAEA